MTRHPAARLVVPPYLLLLGAAACARLERFDTGENAAYCGEIISASFVRQGFSRDLQLELKLDLSQLNSSPGRLRTNDGEAGPCSPQPSFDGAPLRSPRKVEADPLSSLEFGDSREHNFMSWVDSECTGTHLAIVSLMHDDSVEVRLMRGEVNAQGEEIGPFGVFALRRQRGACPF